jgi:predicted RNase H-like HicB family nuclease
MAHTIFLSTQAVPASSSCRTPKSSWGWGWLKPYGGKLVFERHPMRYPITIEPGTDTTAWGVVVPDLPGCFSAGDTLEEALIEAETAITGWIETAIDDGQAIPVPSHIETLRTAHPEYEGWLWALVKVDPAMLDDKLERVNISLPRRVLYRLDARARDAGETRSGYIARMAVESREPAHA